MVDESPTGSFKGLISKILEDHRSRTDPPLLLKNGSQFKKNLEVVSVLKLTSLALTVLVLAFWHI